MTALPVRNLPQPRVAPPVRLTVPDPNELAQLTAWQMDFRQLDPGPLQASLCLRASSTMSLLSIGLSRGMHQRGAPPKGLFTFGLPDESRLVQWQGKDIDADTLLVFGDETGSGYDSVSARGFSGTVLSIDETAMARVATASQIDIPDGLETPQPILAQSARKHLARLAALTDGLLADNPAPWTRDAEDTIILDILATMSGGRAHDTKSHPAARAKALHRAIDIMEHRAEDPVPISEICKECGASWRTLDRAFKETFGLGPKAYYTRLRLGHARRALRRTGPAGSISDIANLYGFWHMGQFARDYKNLFYELPSETCGLACLDTAV